MMVAIIYFILSFAASRLIRHLEHSLTPKYLRKQGRKAKALAPEIAVMP